MKRKPVMKLVLQELKTASFDMPKYAASLHPVAQAASKIKKRIHRFKRSVENGFEPGPDTLKDNEKSEEFLLNQAIQRLSDQIEVRPVEDTRIMEIHVTDALPERARFIADAVAEKYMAFNRAARLSQANDKLDWMTKELFEVRKKLEASEKAFIDYKQNHKVFSMEGRQTVINQKIAVFNKSYLDARNKKLELDITLKNLRQTLNSDSNFMQINEKELAYSILQRNVNTNQDIYDLLLAQIRESNILMSGYTSNLTIAERAETPELPVRPNRKRNFLLSLILGLFGGLGLCFLLDYLDQTIRNEEEIETALGYPVLTVVPDAGMVNPSQGVC